MIEWRIWYRGADFGSTIQTYVLRARTLDEARTAAYGMFPGILVLEVERA